VFSRAPGRPWEIVNKTNYDQNWRMGELVIVPKEHEQAFLKASSAVS